MNSFNLANVIAPDFEEYTSIEIAILLREIILEIRRRQKASPKIIDNYNQETFEFTHKIELNGGLSRKEKADFYEEMEEHFKDRRLAKNEHIVTDEIFNELDWNTDRILQSMTPELKRKVSYFQLQSGERAVRKSEWEDYYERVYKRFL